MSLTRLVPFFALALWLTACASSSRDIKPDEAVKNPVNALTGIRVDKSDGETGVTLDAVSKPVYTVFRMKDPQRLIVDLSNCRMKDVAALTQVRDGRVAAISVSDFEDQGNAVTRVMVALNREAEFSVTEAERSITVKLVDAAAPAVAETSAVTEPAPAAPEVAETAPETVPAPACNPDAPETVISYGGKSSQAKLRSVSLSPSGEGVTLNLRTSGKLADDSVEALRLCNPDRLVLDLYGVKNETGSISLAGDGANVNKIRLGAHKDKLRLVFDLAKPLPVLNLKTEKSAIVLALSAAPEAAVARTEAPAPAPVAAVKEEAKPVAKTEEAPAPVVTPPAPVAASSKLAQIQSLDFQHQKRSSIIAVKISGQPVYRLIESAKDQYVLELKNAELPEHLEQSLDTSSFEGPVAMVSSYVADPDKRVVKIVAQTRSAAPNKVRLENGTLLWQFEGREEAASNSTANGHLSLTRSGETVVEYDPGEAAGYMSGSAVARAATAADETSGQRISLELKNTDILDVLRLIADVSKLNIITSDDVNGTITVRLLNVPWQQALDIILRSKSLGQERQGNIIRVAPLAVLQKEREMRVNQIKAQRELEPLSVRLIPVSYSVASDLLEKVKDLLSNRGTANFDKRTNVIIVKDIDEVLSKAESLVSKLDLQTPQVMIEAKIVETDANDESAFGIQWGTSGIMSAATGNPTGLTFPATVGISGAQSYANTGVGLPNTSQPPNWVINVPTTTTPAAGLGATFGNVTNTANLTLRLTALEATGRVKIVSSPRISTLDNKQAVIEQGLQVPMMTTTITGIPTTKMVEANMQLKVTPHITADGSIIMKLEIIKRDPDFSRTNYLGDPALINKRADTEVLVRTGETTVIGGIYTKKTTVKETGVPGLMRVPILGWLFKNHSATEQKTELLIFVTPRIINRAQSSLVTE